MPISGNLGYIQLAVLPPDILPMKSRTSSEGESCHDRRHSCPTPLAIMNNRRRRLRIRHQSSSAILGSNYPQQSSHTTGTSNTSHRSRLVKAKSMVRFEDSAKRWTAGCGSDKSPMSPVRSWQEVAGPNVRQQCSISRSA